MKIGLISINMYSKKDDVHSKRKLKEFAYKRDAYKSVYHEREIRYEKFQSFIEQNYIKTKECYDSNLLEVSDPGFDCYICVTDVIWKNEPGEGFDRDFYAAFSKKPEEERYILLYYVVERTSDTIEMAVEYARTHNIKIVELTDSPFSERLDGYEGIDKVYRYDIGIEEWLGYIMHAECVFTNSFHGFCFSILFEKKFFVGRRNGDKITNLLQMLGLSGLRVSSFSEIASMGKKRLIMKL